MPDKRRTMNRDPRERPTSIGPTHDDKAGTQPIPDDPPKGPPHAVTGRSKKAKVAR